MADYGIEIAGDSGHIQLNSFELNLVRIGKSDRTVSIPNNGKFMGRVHIYFPWTVTTDTPPLVMMRAVSGLISFCNYSGGKNNWTGFYVTTTHSNSSKSVRFVHEVYAFGKPDMLKKASDYGLQIWNDDGSLSYDSSYPPLHLAYSGNTRYKMKLNTKDSKYVIEKSSGADITVPSGQLIDANVLGAVSTFLEIDGDIDQGSVQAGSITTGAKFFLVPQSNGSNTVEWREAWYDVKGGSSDNVPGRSSIEAIASYLTPTSKYGEEDFLMYYLLCYEKP